MHIKIGSFHFDAWHEKPHKASKNKGGRPRIQLDTDQVIRMRDEGMSLREIGAELHVSKNVVVRILKECQR